MSRILKELEQVIFDRQRQNDPRSYTCRLLTQGSLAERKVNEEAYELIEAAFNGGKNEIVHEAADLIFHFLALIRKYGVGLEDIEKELLKRRKANENP